MDQPTTFSVFISYSHFDKEWRNGIAANLERRSLKVLDDTLLTAGESWTASLTSMREQARVAILIITPHFLQSDSIQKEELPHLLTLRDSRGLHLLPVVAETSGWQDVESLRRIQVFPTSGRPLSSLSQPDLARNLVRLAELVLKLLEDPVPPTPQLEA